MRKLANQRAARRNPRVFGIKRSVYTRTVLIALLEKGVPYHFTETDPFASTSTSTALNPHPFGRVPFVQHGDTGLYETNAITSYVDTMFDGPSLSPEEPFKRVRSQQVISIIDNYLYWPLVRQVYAHSISLPAYGRPHDQNEVNAGLSAAPLVLGSLEKLSQEGQVLTGDHLQLADMQLAPMIDYFLRVPKAEALFGQYPYLNNWWNAASERSSVRKTRPNDLRTSRRT